MSIVRITQEIGELSFSKLDKILILDDNGNKIIEEETMSYFQLLIKLLIKCNYSIQEIKDKTNLNILLHNETTKGFSYISELHISIQHKDANNTFKEIIKIIEYRKLKIIVKIKTKKEGEIIYTNKKIIDF